MTPGYIIEYFGFKGKFLRFRRRFFAFTFLAGRVFFLVAIMLATFFPVSGNEVRAGQIDILTPRNQAVIYARSPITSLVIKLADQNDIKGLKVLSGGKGVTPRTVKSTKVAHYLHFQLELHPGSNEFTVNPGNQKIRIKYQPLRTMLAANFEAPGVYLFHRREDVPKECKNCHNTKMAKKISGERPLYGSFSGICYTCHKSMLVNSVWLHSPAANILCRSCHQPDQKSGKIVMPSGKVDNLCFNCHVNERKWPAMAHVHGPVGTGDCTVCHNPHGDKYRYQLWADGKMDLCLACHVDKKAYAQGGSIKYPHGILQGQGCVACHSPHATNNRFQLYKPINELCSSCHTSITGQKGHPVKGHPVKGKKDPRRPDREFGCTSCHNPHGSEFRYMLIGSHLGNRVCRKCHK